MPDDDDLEMDSPTAQDGHVDSCVELPGPKTQGLVSIVMTDPSAAVCSQPISNTPQFTGFLLIFYVSN